MKSYLLTGILVFAITTISLSLLSEQVLAQSNMPMSPRQQMSMLNDPSQVQCREGYVMMMRGTDETPVCINPNTSWRLADRGWGNFDMNMMMNNNPQQFQSLTNSMMNNPNTSNLWYDLAFDPNRMQDVADQMTSSMRQNPQMMNPMLNFMMNDPELRQQMIDQMMQNPQMMKTVRGNSTMMGMMMDGQPMMMNQGMMNMMNDPQTRQEIMSMMMNDPQMMQDMMNNNMMRGMMNQGMMMNNNMMNMDQGMMMGRGPMMGGGMGQNMMMNMNNTNMMGPMMNDPELRQQMIDQMMQNPQMMQDMMNNNMMRDMMGMNPMMNNWQMQNQEMMQEIMNQMMNDPEIMQQMNDMMLKNPWHMKGMMNSMMGPMMSDPELRQQMMNNMMTNPQMMQSMIDNQQFLDNLQKDDMKTETNDPNLNSQNTQVSIALGSASPECAQTNECYLPYSVSIKEYSSATWTNDDTTVHTATSGVPSEGPDGIFDSGLISPGKTFTNQFDEEGTFDYYCIAHPWMTGNVVVIE